MSGHSKWANIKRTKAKVDAARGKIFTKIGRELMVAVKLGGPNPEANMRLKMVIQKARDANMPMENIKRAIERASGGGEGNYEEMIYEGYGPGGVGVIMEIMTDNRNRTAGEIRHLFSRHGGNLGETGSVGWMFDRKGLVVINKEENEGRDEDELLMLALDAGAEDFKDEGDQFEVITPPDDYQAVREALEKAGVKVASAQSAMIPKNTVELTGEDAEKMLRLMEALEEHDDVQNVYANFDIPDDEMEKISQ